MRTSFTFKIGGEAGFGIMTTGIVFARTCTRSGYTIFNYPEYPSLIRGGHNVVETHFSKDPLYAQERGIDLLAALNRQTIDLHKNNMKDDGAVVYDPDQFQVSESDFSGKHILLIPVPMKKIVAELKALKIMENNVALGAAVALFGLPIENLTSVIEDIFGGKKGAEIANENKKSAQAGYDFVKSSSVSWATTAKSSSTTIGEKDKLVITVNEMVGMGAIAAGCQLYAAYPMTPSSALLHFLAKFGPKSGMVVRHAEDEVGVINEAIGSSFAGVRTMVGTSGGGYALMNEGISFAGISETGLVVIMGQRPGPATGLPTWTEQGDLQFIIRSGHGEFPKIVLAPGDLEEVYQLTTKAFDLADTYQTPVVLMTDKYLAESQLSVDSRVINDSKTTITRGKWEQVTPNSTGEVSPYPRYKVTEDGISPRILPGSPGYFFQTNSYEHIEDGHTTEDSVERIKQVDKRSRKATRYLSHEFEIPKLYGDESADITFVSWGSQKLPILDAMAQDGGTIAGKKINLLNFTHMWPLDGKRIGEELHKHKQLVLVENNSTGQLGQLIRQETGVSIDKRLLKYDGRPIYPEEITEFVSKL